MFSGFNIRMPGLCEIRVPGRKTGATPAMNQRTATGRFVQLKPKAMSMGPSHVRARAGLAFPPFLAAQAASDSWREPADRVLVLRQGHEEAGTALLGSDSPGFTPMQLRHTLDNRQAQAAAGKIHR